MGACLAQWLQGSHSFGKSNGLGNPGDYPTDISSGIRYPKSMGGNFPSLCDGSCRHLPTNQQGPWMLSDCILAFPLGSDAPHHLKSPATSFFLIRRYVLLNWHRQVLPTHALEPPISMTESTVLAYRRLHPVLYCIVVGFSKNIMCARLLDCLALASFTRFFHSVLTFLGS